MDIDLNGFHSHCKNKLMGGLIIHNGRCMTERETRIAVNYGIAMGYELASEIPTEKIDEICDPTAMRFGWTNLMTPRSL